MRKIFCDFDGVIMNSCLIVTEILNERFKTNISWKDVKKYDFTDMFPSITKEEIKNIFDSKEFFDKAKLNIFPQAIDIINKLCKDFEVIILSIGTSLNIQRKIEFLNNMFPNIKNHIMIVKQDCIMDKSIIKMNEQDIIIDDVVSNLISSTAGTKILFSFYNIKTEWNSNNEFEIIGDWKDIERRIYDNTSM